MSIESLDQTSKEEDNKKRGKVFSTPTKPRNPLKDSTIEQSHRFPSQPEDPDQFRLVPTHQSNLGLWEQAWERVKTVEEDRKFWLHFQPDKDLKTKDVVTEILVPSQTRREETEKNQQHVFGTSLTYRKMCSGVAKCVKKYEIVGDLVAQAEPVYTALPWVIMSISKHPFL